MITLHFERSRSKKLNDAVKLAGLFNVKVENGYTVSPDIKSIFERWEDFDLLFWTCVDWSGTYLELDGMKYYSHNDKTGIFYALQMSHLKWMNYVEIRTCKFFHDGQFNLTQDISEKDADLLIDIFTMKKTQK